MFVLFETPAGYAVFKQMDEGKLAKSDSLYEDFETVDQARNVLKLKRFQKCEDANEALSAAIAAVEGKMSKSLQKLLKKVIAEVRQNAFRRVGYLKRDKLIADSESELVWRYYHGNTVSCQYQVGAGKGLF